ncbi:CaiB/BaiF CoA-transferase family protein [Sphingobium sp. LB126]|uniref:CaiB/BaiF CoA transferase family protein n=1 Tax=Sphingobium sp. LB126 TaxID=1983755 RepID=UPI0012FDB9C9|nr:CaiB/BaiF CoA-transferase family protein [Sphingobium sp. LB126]
MYDLLAGVRVLDVSLLAPDMLAMNLADLGADVIKIEAPPYGDHARVIPGRIREGAPSSNHLRWNRGKRSLLLNLKNAQGVQIFLELAKKADVVVEGLRAGTMARFGVGYDVVRQVNPKIVFCSISGTGQTGPYVHLGMHGAGLDSIAGGVSVAFREDGRPFVGQHIAFGTRVGPLYAAFAVAAALVKAARTGEGSYIDVAQTDAAAFAEVDRQFHLLNTGVELPGDLYRNAVRNQCYRTRDSNYILFQAFEHKFWVNFCLAIERPDLVARGGDQTDVSANALNMAMGDEALRAELAEIMATRTQREWIDFFIAHNIPGAPINSLTQAMEDPHFKARDNIYVQEHPTAGPIRMLSTPIKVPGQQFDVRPAPDAGEHTDEVLGELLGFDDATLTRLKAERVIGSSQQHATRVE